MHYYHQYQDSTMVASSKREDNYLFAYGSNGLPPDDGYGTVSSAP